MIRSYGLLVLSVAVACFPAVLPADTMADASISLTSLGICAGTLTPLGMCVGGLSVQFSGVTATAFASVFDLIAGNDQDYDPGPSTASVSVSAGAAKAKTDATASSLTADASSSVLIPFGVTDTAGTDNVGPYGDVSGTFEIMDSTTHPVSVTFSDTLTGSQNLTSDSTTLYAYSEAIFNFTVTGQFTTGPNSVTELFLDSRNTIPPPVSWSSTIASVGPATDSTLMTNTPYSFDAQVDAETAAATYVPEPSFIVLSALGLVALVCARWMRRRRRPELID
jgi:hypothetical protein